MLKWLFFIACKKILGISCVLILKRALYHSHIWLKLWLISNRTLCRPIRCVIIFVIKQIGLHKVVVWFCQSLIWLQPWEYEDWMKNSDENVNVRAFHDAQKQYLGGRDYSHTWIITKMSHPTLYSKRWLWWHDLHPAPDPWRGVLLGILGGGVVTGSPNPDLIADQKMSFSTPVFRPDL